MRDKMIFDREMHNFLSRLNEEDFSEAFAAICEYSFYDILPER